MRWGTVVNAITTHENKSDVDPHELLMAQLITVSMLIIWDRGNKLNEDDWQKLFRWLNLQMPDNVLHPRFENYRPGLNVWLQRTVKQASPENPVECLLKQLVHQLGEMLQLRKIEQQFLMLAWLRFQHEKMNSMAPE